MKLRLLVPALALTLSCMAAHAQVGLYLNPVVTRVSNSQGDTGPFAFLGQNTTSRFFGGVDFGGYYDFAHYDKAVVGVDLRDTIQHANNASLNTFLVGLRVAGTPSPRNFKPYLQLSVGEGRTKAPLNTVHISKLAFEVFGGVDKTLSRHVDWRMVEVGYGSVSTISSGNFGGTVALPSARLLTFSTGLVFRVP